MIRWVLSEAKVVYLLKDVIEGTNSFKAANTSKQMGYLHCFLVGRLLHPSQNQMSNLSVQVHVSFVSMDCFELVWCS